MHREVNPVDVFDYFTEETIYIIKQKLANRIFKNAPKNVLVKGAVAYGNVPMKNSAPINLFFEYEAVEKEDNLCLMEITSIIIYTDIPDIVLDKYSYHKKLAESDKNVKFHEA